MMWMDDNPKKSIGDKVREGAAAYEQRFHHAPLVVCVSPTTTLDDTTLKVQPLPTIQKDNFWFGMELQ